MWISIAPLALIRVEHWAMTPYPPARRECIVYLAAHFSACARSPSTDTLSFATTFLAYCHSLTVAHSNIATLVQRASTFAPFQALEYRSKDSSIELQNHPAISTTIPPPREAQRVSQPYIHHGFRTGFRNSSPASGQRFLPQTLDPAGF